jgi:hypothetical protein
VAYLICPTIFLELLKRTRDNYRKKEFYLAGYMRAVIAVSLTLVSSLTYSSTLKMEETWLSKRRLTLNGLHDTRELFIMTVVRTSNPAI